MSGEFAVIRPRRIHIDHDLVPRAGQLAVRHAQLSREISETAPVAARDFRADETNGASTRAQREHPLTRRGGGGLFDIRLGAYRRLRHIVRGIAAAQQQQERSEQHGSLHSVMKTLPAASGYLRSTSR